MLLLSLCCFNARIEKRRKLLRLKARQVERQKTYRNKWAAISENLPEFKAFVDANSGHYPNDQITEYSKVMSLMSGVCFLKSTFSF
jgi:hypothetical protein